MILMSHTSVEAKAIDLVEGEVCHPTDQVLHEIEQPEPSGYQIGGNWIDEKTSIPTYPKKAAELSDHAVVLLGVTAGGRAVPSIEAETTVIPAGQDLLCDASLRDEMSDHHPLQEDALDLHTTVDH